MQPPTKQELSAGVAIVAAVAETVRECGECPSGMLYAGLIGRVTKQGYDQVLAILKGAGLIEVTPQHMVRWTGPMIAGGAR